MIKGGWKVFTELSVFHFKIEIVVKETFFCIYVLNRYYLLPHWSLARLFSKRS